MTVTCEGLRGRPRWRLVVAVWLACGVTPAARASEPHPAVVSAYALVIGSNAGGPGQQPLHFAESDAVRFSEALVELGRLESDHVLTLARPTRAQVSDALSEVGRKLHEDARAGIKTTLIVYYSGHARAEALNLGEELLGLADLREAILALPGDLKLVILDACQSGAFSRAKGAESSTDFSFNSVEQLRTAGIAVMASSAASELSQESERLQASYFTHHVLVALRGAGDANHDGIVTLAETYQYAYHRTLTSTAETAIGGQHVTLEMELRGQGEVPLSFPAAPDATLRLPADLQGDLIVTQVPSRSVMVEARKEPGQEFSVALPSGRYEALLRRGHRVYRCDLVLARSAVSFIDVGACAVTEDTPSVAKGDSRTFPVETWSLQLGIGLGKPHRDGYEGTLRTFGYQENGNGFGRYAVGGGFAAWPHLVLGAQFQNLDARQYSRDTQGVSQNLEWYAYGIGPTLRLQPDWRRVLPYVEVGAGMTVARTTFDEIVVDDPGFTPELGSDEVPPISRVRRTDWHAGAYVSLALGAALMFRHVGCFAQFSWLYAPTITNQIGDRHDVGGFTFLTGVRFRGVKTP